VFGENLVFMNIPFTKEGYYTLHELLKGGKDLPLISHSLRGLLLHTYMVFYTYECKCFKLPSSFVDVDVVT
jgi:hypothetical protein